MMTSSVIVLGVFVLLVAPTSDFLASLSTLLHPTLVLQKKDHPRGIQDRSSLYRAYVDLL
jgi:hypothetical protein